MYITKEDFKVIEKALKLLPQGENFEALDKETQDIITTADVIMVNLLKKKKESNTKIAKYIADKRKTNKNYARKK